MKIRERIERMVRRWVGKAGVVDDRVAGLMDTQLRNKVDAICRDLGIFREEQVNGRWTGVEDLRQRLDEMSEMTELTDISERLTDLTTEVVVKNRPRMAIMEDWGQTLAGMDDRVVELARKVEVKLMPGLDDLDRWVVHVADLDKRLQAVTQRLCGLEGEGHRWALRTDDSSPVVLPSEVLPNGATAEVYCEDCFLEGTIEVDSNATIGEMWERVKGGK